MRIFEALAGPAVVLLAVLPGACRSPAPAEPDLRSLVVTMTREAWNLGNVEVFDSTMAEELVFHYAGTPRQVTREEMAGAVRGWRDAFPDLEMEIQEAIQEGSLVAARMTLTGTHEGPWRGVAPTGREVTMPLMIFFRFEDGRLVELWEVDDQLGLRRQLGLLE